MSLIDLAIVFSKIDETCLQNLLTEVYENYGWEVKNLHRIDPKSEDGADLELKRGTEKILIAVKNKPVTKDVEQLKRLWNDTGYWAAADSENGYTGLSEDSALALWKNSDKLKLCYVASNLSTLLEFTLDKQEADRFSLNVYYSNRFVVFPDLIDTIHKALNKLGSWKTLRIEQDDHDAIFDIQTNNTRMKMNEPNSFTISPKRVIPLRDDPYPGTDWLSAVVIENIFFTHEDTMTKPNGYAIVIRGGGWMRRDFQENNKHVVSFSEVRKLENCFILSIVVNAYKEENSALGRLLK